MYKKHGQFAVVIGVVKAVRGPSNIMNFKVPGITWVGNIYQKVEAACHDVEELVSKDTVKYVENKVHNAGENIFKFYSDVVQDILPPLVNHVKDDSREIAQKGNAALKNYFKSMEGHEENLMNSVVEQSETEPHASDPEKYQPTNEPSSHDTANEQTTQASNDSGFGSDYELLLEKSDDFFIDQRLGVRLGGREGSIAESESEVSELVSPRNKKQVEASFCSDVLDDTLENEPDALVETSYPSSNHDVELASSEIGETLDVNAGDGVDLLTSTGFSIESKCPSSPCLTAEVASSVATCERSVFEMRLNSSCSSLLEESCSHSNLPENFPSGTDIPDGPIAHPSTAILPRTSCENAETSLFPSSCPAASIQPFEDNKARVYEAAVGESFGNEHSDFSGVSSEAPSSDTGFHGANVLDSNLETIDLHDEAEFKDSCFNKDDVYAFHQVDRRIQKQRSYRDRIKAALSSKKRREKEYKLLSIWYGDSDLCCIQETGFPPSPSIQQLQGKNSLAIDDSESEWELL